MTNLEKIEAEEAKQQRIQDNNYCCEVCKERFGASELQLAHKIPKHDRYIKKWGAKIIHHRLNIVLTCSKCNASVMINPNDNYGKALIEEIEKSILTEQNIGGI